MSSLFVHTDFVPGDENGFGLWRIEHFYAHQQYIQKASQQNPPLVLREIDILGWSDDEKIQKLWNEGHYEMHLSLREATGLTDVTDFSEIDWNDPRVVVAFLENHANEHAYFDQVFGL